MTSGDREVPCLGRDEVRDGPPRLVPGFLCDLGSNNIAAIGEVTSICYATPFLLCRVDDSEGRGPFFRMLVYAPSHLLLLKLGFYLRYIQIPAVHCALSLGVPSQRLHWKQRIPSLLSLTVPGSTLQTEYAWCLAPVCVPVESSCLHSSRGQDTACAAVHRQDGVSLWIIYSKNFLEAWSLTSAGEPGLFRLTVILFP